MSQNTKTNTRTYKPKIITSCDDESFVYGPLLNGPISFVRVDEQYQQYLDSKIRGDLPQYPTKKQKEYYKPEFDFKKEIKEDEIEKEKLLKRKAKEQAAFDEYAKEVISEREKEQARIDELIKKELERRENEALDKLRIAIIDEAKKDMASNVKENKDEKK